MEIMAEDWVSSVRDASLIRHITVSGLSEKMSTMHAYIWMNIPLSFQEDCDYQFYRQENFLTVVSLLAMRIMH